MGRIFRFVSVESLSPFVQDAMKNVHEISIESMGVIRFLDFMGIKVC